MRNPCEHISPLDDYGKCEINANIIYPFAHSSIYLFFEIVLPGRTFSLPPLSHETYKIRTKKEQKSNDNYHLVTLRNSLSLSRIILFLSPNVSWSRWRETRGVVFVPLDGRRIFLNTCSTSNIEAGESCRLSNTLPALLAPILRR